MQGRTLTELDSLLTRERLAILAAQYDELAEIAGQKIACLKRLDADPPDQTSLKELKALMDANQSLISAALRGVAAARDRVAALESVRDSLTTYDKSGKVSLVQTARKRVEKKA